MNVPFYGHTRQYHDIKGEIDANIQKVLESGQYVQGPMLKQFEAELAAYAGKKHAIGVGNGTDAIWLTMMALGLKAGFLVLARHAWWAGRSGDVGLLTEAQTRLNVAAISDLIAEAWLPENARRVLIACLAGVSPAEVAGIFTDVAFQLRHGLIMQISGFHLPHPITYPPNLLLVGTMDADHFEPPNTDLLEMATVMRVRERVGGMTSRSQISFEANLEVPPLSDAEQAPEADPYVFLYARPTFVIRRLAKHELPRVPADRRSAAHAA